MDFNEGFPYIEVANFDGWLVQITAHLRGKNLHLALQEEGRPKPPVGEDNEPVEQTAAAKKLLTKSQDLWDAADRAAMADLMKACRKDADTKLLTETGNFTTALSLLERLKERFKSTVSRQLDEEQKISRFFNAIQATGTVPMSLAMDVGKGQKRTRCIDSPVRRRGGVE
jgi:hypothetical protein